MPLQSIACHLYEPDGASLSTATCLFDDTPAPLDAPPQSLPPVTVLTALDRPGRVVERCLLGPVGTVWLHLRDETGTLLPAEVEQVFFDPAAGRCCAVRLTHAPLPETSAVPETGPPSALTNQWRRFITATEARYAAVLAAQGVPCLHHTPAELETVARLVAATGLTPPHSAHDG